MKYVQFDGVAGGQFDAAISGAEKDPERCSDYIELAIKLDVPIEGLVADGEFGGKWAEVVKLCKETAS